MLYRIVVCLCDPEFLVYIYIYIYIYILFYCLFTFDR